MPPLVFLFIYISFFYFLTIFFGNTFGIFKYLVAFIFYLPKLVEQFLGEVEKMLNRARNPSEILDLFRLTVADCLAAIELRRQCVAMSQAETYLSAAAAVLKFFGGGD